MLTPKGAAVLENRLEAIVPVREQAGFLEPDPELPPALDDRWRRDRRARGKMRESFGGAVDPEVVGRAAPAHQPDVIGQLGNQPDVASGVLEDREHVAAGQPVGSHVPGVRRDAGNGPARTSGRKSIEADRRSDPPRPAAIAKHAAEGIAWNLARELEPGGHEATAVELR